MLYVGVDQHKKFSQVAVMNETGSIMDNRRLYHCDKEGIRRYFEELGEETTAVLEATRNWYWLYDLLEEEVSKVKMAHPAKVRLIAEARTKTDKIDATVLAHLERTGFLPEAYVCTQEIRGKREVHRFRVALVRMQTMLKNRVHSVLDKLGIEHPYADLFGEEGRKFLGSLSLERPYQVELDICLRLLDKYREELEAVRGEIRRTLKEDSRAALLMSVPGIGELTAYLLLHEIGDIRRFASAKKFASYCALVPRTRQSGERSWGGHIGKFGNLYLKWALVEASHVAVRKDPALGAFYEYKSRIKGKGRAIVIVAEKLSRAIYHILSEGREYRYNSLSKRHLGKPVRQLGR